MPYVKLLSDHIGDRMPARARRDRVVGSLLVVLATTAGLARAQDAEAARIARVESGLLPRAVPKGHTGQRASIVERMTHHAIPA